MADQDIAADPLAQFSMEEINAMQVEFNATIDAYRNHRTASTPPGVARVPFNFANFFANAVKIYNFVAPLISQFSGVKLPPIPAALPVSTP